MTNSRKIIFLANIALAGLLGYVVFKVALPPLKSPLPVPVRAGTQSPNPSVSSDTLPPIAATDYQTLLQNNLFARTALDTPGGQAASSSKPMSADPAATDELKLELIGTITGPPSVARALIKDLRSDTTDMYRIGQPVAGAAIVQIEKNAVTLLQHGKKITLTHPTALLRPERPELQADRMAQSIETPSRSDFISLAVLGNILEDVFQHATFSPYLLQDQPQGLRIAGLKNVPNAGFLPLKEGDVIRAVNGQLLTDRQKAFQVLRKARTQPFFDVELLREGERKSFSFIQGKNEKQTP